MSVNKGHAALDKGLNVVKCKQGPFRRELVVYTRAPFRLEKCKQGTCWRTGGPCLTI